jgi:hypothetical protein
MEEEGDAEKIVNTSDRLPHPYGRNSLAITLSLDTILAIAMSTRTSSRMWQAHGVRVKKTRIYTERTSGKEVFAAH